MFSFFIIEKEDGIMKLKQEFVLREVAGEHVLIPLAGLTDSFQGIITLNESGVFIWKHIEEGADEEEIISCMCEEYEVSVEKASEDVKNFIGHLKDLGIVS